LFRIPKQSRQSHSCQPPLAGQGLDPVHDLREREAGGVDLDGVVGRAQGAVLATLVAGVALALRGEDRGWILARLRRPPPGALLGRGGEEDLERRVGADHGADVATLGDVAAGGDQPPLLRHHRLSHRRMDRDERGCLGDARLADRRADVAPVELDPPAVERDRQRARHLPDRCLVAELSAALERRQRHAAIHRPRVEVGEAESLRERAGNR
jgi:hypothetical protein